MSSIPEPPEFFSLDDAFAVYSPKAEISLDDAVEMISKAVTFCRENSVGALLIDARELFGFPHPTVVDRYWFLRKWATDAAGKVVLSFIQRPEMIDPHQIGITMAANAGLTINVFETEEAAREWLLANIKSESLT